MGTVVEKIQKIDQTKGEIRQAINEKGVPVSEGAKFSEYPDAIRQIKQGGGTASDVTVDNSVFQVITGANVQTALKDVDTKLALNENYDSFLLSLDTLEKDIGAITNVPLQSLQAQMHDGRPSHKEAGASVYDEFGTLGIIDTIQDGMAQVATVTTSGSSGRIIETLDIQQNGLGQYYVALTADQIRNEINRDKIVQLRFDDVIENTGEQLYPFETFDKENYAVFRRNVITAEKAERINIKVNYQGIVTFEKVAYNGATKTYVNDIVGNINTVLDNINGETI